MSQNTLGTLTSTAGYSYHKGFHAGHLRVDYSGLLPVISLKFDINDRFRTHTLRNDGQDSGGCLTQREPHYMEASCMHTFLTFNGHGWQRTGAFCKVPISNDSYGIPTPAVPVSQTCGRASSTTRWSTGHHGTFSKMASTYKPPLLPEQRPFLPDPVPAGLRIPSGDPENQALKWNVGWQEQWIKDRHLYLENLSGRSPGDQHPSSCPWLLFQPLTMPSSVGRRPVDPGHHLHKTFSADTFADFMQTGSKTGQKPGIGRRVQTC